MLNLMRIVKTKHNLWEQLTILLISPNSMMQNSNAVVHTVLQNKVFRQKQNGRLKENNAFPDTKCPFKFWPRISVMNHT